MGCVETQTVNEPRRRATSRGSHKKSTKAPKFISRLSSRVKIDDVHEISESQKRSGVKPVYTCPICFLYYNKILACSECANLICIHCFQKHENKLQKRMKCSFCASRRSLFLDYQLEAHSYFDSSGKGFMSKQQRDRIDAQILENMNRMKTNRSIQTINQASQN